MNPYEYLLPVQRKNFVGRYEIVDRICDQTTHSGGQVYAVLAGRRCGKTSLLNVVRQTLLDGFANNPVIPVAVDMEKGFHDPEHFYSYIVRKVYYQAVASWPELAKFLVRHEQDKMSNSELEEILLNLLNVIKLRALVRIVLMIDEVDLVLRHPWYTTLFEQLRELLTSSDIKDNISLILFGADYFYETKEQGGSPLLNIAIPEFLYNVNQADINDLIEIGGKCSDELANQVWTFSGGQLHVAQYLLHHIWKPTGFNDIRARDVRKVVHQYYRDHLSNLKKWLDSTGVDGCVMYDLIARSGEWMDELVLAKKAKISVNQAKTALDKLCLQGVVIIDRETYTHYKAQGDLFRQWFTRNRTELLKPRAEAKPHSKTQNDVSGVPESSSATYIEHIDIVQQVIEAHRINGNVSQHTGLKRSEVTKLFKAIYDDIERRPSTTPAEKKTLTKTVKEIEENISSQKPSKKFLEERFHNLGKMAPDILEVALAALANPATGLKVLAEKIAAKVKSDAS
jgi:hypothetical protein